jgi:hypothetical protein
MAVLARRMGVSGITNPDEFKHCVEEEKVTVVTDKPIIIYTDNVRISNVRFVSSGRLIREGDDE